MIAQSDSSSSRDIFALSPRIDLVPILHGSGNMAQAVRDYLLERRRQCLAVPLPPSFENVVLRGIDRLPLVSVAVMAEPAQESTVNYVPIDPCQAVIMGIRLAVNEGMDVAFIDREVQIFEPSQTVYPDPFALKSVSLDAFMAALLPFLPEPGRDTPQWHRLTWMAFQLHVLEMEYSSIVCLCALQDWPWLRWAYRARAQYREPETMTESPMLCHVPSSSLYFALGELPFLTEIYERRRREARADALLSLDGVKELLLEARDRWKSQCDEEGRDDHLQLTPQLLQRYLQYVRNLAVLEHRLTPDLYTLVLAARQMVGDAFAIALLETAKRYVFQEQEGNRLPEAAIGIGEIALPDGEVVKAKNRLAGQPVQWRSLSLRPPPPKLRKRAWAYQWNPYRQCSWPPEDVKLEAFTAHVRDHARALLGADLPRVEKFTTSLRDGIDCRETLRHRMTPARSTRPRDIYVRDLPPSRGSVDVVVMFFDVPADPRKYAWRATWYAEHDQESTLCFFATPFADHMIGPGIGQSLYGGALFVFPPRLFPDIWEDPQFRWTHTLEERLVAAACTYARERHIVVVAPCRPRWAWHRIARRYRRALIPVSLGHFSRQTIERLRRFHVLNGHEIRSYAAQFIR